MKLECVRKFIVRPWQRSKYGFVTRARLQPGRIESKSNPALAAAKLRVAEANVQGLKPGISFIAFAARLKPCPCYKASKAAYYVNFS
jgi:hypothetical protein